MKNKHIFGETDRNRYFIPYGTLFVDQVHTWVISNYRLKLKYFVFYVYYCYYFEYIIEYQNVRRF